MSENFSGPASARKGIEGIVSQNRRDIVALMKNVMRDKSRLPGIAETDDSYRITHPLLISSLMNEFVKPVKLREAARECLIKDLAGLGYDVALLTEDPEHYVAIDNDFLPIAKSAGIRDGRFIFVEDEGLYPYVCFPRDLFVQIEDRLFLTPQYYEQNIRGLSSWAKGLLKAEDGIGNGGENVVGDDAAFICPWYLPPDIALYSDYSEEELRQMQSEPLEHKQVTFEKFGIKSFVVPHGWSNIFTRDMLDEIHSSKKVLIPSDHADMSILYLSRERAFLPLESYYQENKPLLDRIVEDLHPEIFDTLPDENGYPANSLPLPDGGVFMDKAAEKSVAKLKGLGLRVETTSMPFGDWAWGSHGGIHCATNEIWLPAWVEK